MNIIVLIKEVPDMDKVKFDSSKGIIDRSSAESEINPFDLNALQTAVDIKNSHGANITVLTMGPPKAEKSLLDAYARGADEVVLLTDAKFGGSDTFATSQTLAAGIKKLGSYDLIICGEKSVDGDTAQVGAEVAEILDIPHSYYVESINNINDTSLEIKIENICGNAQIRKMTLPALISVTKNINHPKLPTLKRKLGSLNIKTVKLGFSDIREYLTDKDIGFNGSPTKVSNIVIPTEEKKESKIFRESINDFILELDKEFKSKGII